MRRVDGDGSYTLEDPTGATFPSKVTQKHLKLVSTSTSDTESRYEVAEILGHRGSGRNREYLVSWEGYSQADNSWVSISDFDSLELIQEYHKAVPLRVGSATSKRTRKNRK